MSGVAFSTPRRLGAGDQLARWTPTKRQADGDGATPGWFDLRLIRYQIKGFRPSTLVTSVTDPARISREELIRIATADEAGVVLEPGLYHRRWEVETELAHSKTTLRMDVLRCETEAGVLTELTIYAIVYNLVRVVMLEASRRQGVPLKQISFVDALRWLSSSASSTPLPNLVSNPHRPGRVEPRCTKRRAKKYPYMKQPRHVLRQQLFGQRVPAEQRVRCARVLQPLGGSPGIQLLWR